jgi:subtilisin family serine protease
MPLELISPTPRARMRRCAGLLTAALTALAAAIVLGTPATAAEGEIRGAGAPDAVKDSYIVVLRSNDPTSLIDQTARSLAARHGATVTHTYRWALPGFSATMSEQAARQLAADPAVAYVEQDRIMRIATDQANPPWGVDRVDERSLPMDGKYNYDATAPSVRAYIIDTGIRISHDDFGTRASYGRDTVNEDNIASDCHGHGTHVAGTVGGATYGVAKSARLIAVKVMNCAGKGTASNIVEGVDWVTGHRVEPAVANMSVGGGGSDAIDDAVRNSIAAGVTYIVAAGNDNGDDACDHSPARVGEAITVGATTDADARAGYSNVGGCLDLFAPGDTITSTSNSSDAATTIRSGTSMAAPHVTGAIALYLSKRPAATNTQVRSSLLYNATSGVVSNPGSGSPNKLVYRVRGSVITSLSCPPSGDQFICTVQHSSGTPTIQWYFNGAPAYSNAKSVPAACSDQSLLQIRAVLTDAPGGSRDQAIFNIFCGLYPP